MNIRRALLTALLTYISTLIVGVVVGAIFGFKAYESAAIPLEVWMSAAFGAVLLSVFWARWYFKGKVKAGALEGLKLGGIFILVGFLLDVLTFLPLLIEERGLGSILVYYSAPMFWSTLLLILAVTVTAGFMKEKHRSYDN